jgi:hypothetical protein
LTATDSNGEEAVSSASVSVVNSFPSLSNISISPSSVIDSSSTLTCSAVLTDTDEEGLSIDYEWMVNSTTIGTGDTLTLTSSLVQPGDTIVCSATVEDNYGASDSLQESVTISNTAPTISSVAITPDPSYNDGSLECSVVATDADGESLSESYSWTNSTLSTTLGMGSSLSLSSSSASRNDVITCTVTVTDASGDTATETSDLTLTNRAPNSPTVSLSPDPAYVDSTLTCTATATDMDGDSVSYSYAWEIDGVPLSDTTSTLSTAFAAGEFVRCTVTPSDGLLDGSSDSSSLTISNRTPTVDSVSLSPDPLYTDSNIVATASASDLDGDTLSLNYDWYVESVLVQSGVAVSLDFSNYEKDDVVRVEVTADDSAGISTSSSVSITVQNTSPGSPSISISPSEPVAQSDDLVCSVDTASSDVDSDTVTYSFAWTVDSVDYTSATDTETTSTIPASETSTSEEWECTVIPNDGDENGSSTSTSVIMEASGVYAFGETRPPLSCGDFIYNGNNYQQYCFTLKSQTLCIGQTSGGSYSCSDTTDGIQMIFDYSSSWPLRFTANTPSCQNYHPDYIQHLAWALGYENYTIDVTKTGNSCTRTYIDSSGYFQSTGGDSGQAQIYDISFY